MFYFFKWIKYDHKSGVIWILFKWEHSSTYGKVAGSDLAAERYQHYFLEKINFKNEIKIKNIYQNIFKNYLNLNNFI